MTVRVTRKDALVEGGDWPDGGCSLHPSCQACPLPSCRYDGHYRIDILRADIRALAAQRLRFRGGSIEEIQRSLGVSRRTAYRLITRSVSKYAISRPQRVCPEEGVRAV